MKGTETATLTVKQEAVAVLVAAGKDLFAAAREIGVGERTVHTWKHLPAFRAYVAHLRDEMIARAVGKLATASASAVDTLLALLKSEDEGIRLRAAVAVLDGLLKAREHTELARRVAELEALAPNPGGQRWA